MNRVLVVDDEENVQQSVRGVLERFSFHVECVGNAEAAMARFASFEPDLLILDILLPDTSGTDLCRELRRTRDVPIIFLSGLSSEVDRIVGLELGADDYLTKPFHPGELLARVRAVLRRTNGAQSTVSQPPAHTPAHILLYGPIQLDLDRHVAIAQDTTLELTKTEFLLLKTLMRRPTHVFSRDEIMSGVYGLGTYVSDRTINSHVRRLREQFEQFGIDPIDTIRGVGYRMAAFS